MTRTMLWAKIHRATVTESDLDYEGSLTVDVALLEAAGITPFEQVMVSNLNNGERFETYVIEGPRGSGVIRLNGPTARKGLVEDRIVIFCYRPMTEEEAARHRPRIIRVDEKNRLVSGRSGV